MHECGGHHYQKFEGTDNDCDKPLVEETSPCSLVLHK